MIHGLIGALLSVSWSWACGDDDAKTDAASCHEQDKTPADQLDPGRRSRRAELMGAGNCSWSTSMMAERVLSEGAPYTYVGLLEKSENQLNNRVAAPYTVGPDARIHVIANEILDQLDQEEATVVRLELSGKLLDVEGVEYLVVEKVVRPRS